jgi:Flp pilus assembly pilin Flp
VEATVVGGVSLTYQWQISTDDGANWNDINGETNATLNLSGLDSNDIGNQYRVIVGATGEDSVTSNAVSFTATTTTTTTTTPPVYWTQVGADIDGEAAEDYSGYSVALSSDGSRIAIGATFNDGAAVWAGHVRVYDLIGSTWTQVGADIDGEAVGDESGASVALSSDGSRIAIGAIYNDGADVSAGHVRVYDLIGSTWTQVGSDIDGEAAGDYSGHSVALSSDGSRVAVGAILNDGTGTNAGHVRVFDLVGSTWTQVGADIDGEAAGDQSGFSVALSSDGSRVAIGAYANEGNGVYAGHVRVFDLVGTTWTQVGADIDGEAANDNSGRSIALSSDGSRIAIGANVNSGAGLRAGHVRVFDLVGSTWTQVGVDIDGETATGQSGWSVAMSSDGSRVVVGAPYNDGGGDNSGHVRVYDLVGSSWTQVGADIDSEAAGDFSGYSVAISSDGSRVAIGATNNDGTGTNAGHVRIFDFNS